MDRLAVAPSMPPHRHSNVVHIASGTDSSSETVHRFLVNGRKFKYITAGPGVLSMANISALPFSSILPQLPRFPPGPWNVATVARHPHNEGVCFESCRSVSLPGVRNLWHPIRIDQLYLVELEKVENDVYVVGHPWLRHDKVVAVYDHFPTGLQRIENETAVYKAINGRGISYDFVGHIMEGRRAIGYLVEYIRGHRLPGPRDLDACLEIMTRLHNLGYKHGKISKQIFHIRLNKIWLADLSSVTNCTDPREHKLECDIVAFVVAGIAPTFGWAECPPGDIGEASGGGEDGVFSMSASSSGSTNGSTEPSSIEASEEERTTSMPSFSSESMNGCIEPSSIVASVDDKVSSVEAMSDRVNFSTSAIVVEATNILKSAAAKTSTRHPARTFPLKGGMDSVVIRAVKERSCLEVGADGVLFPQPSRDSENDVGTPPTNADSIMIFPVDQMQFDHKEVQRVIDRYDGVRLTTEMEESYVCALLAVGVGEKVVDALVKTHPTPKTNGSKNLALDTSIVQDRSKEGTPKSKGAKSKGTSKSKGNSKSKASASSVTHNASKSGSPGIDQIMVRGQTSESSTSVTLEARKIWSCKNDIAIQDKADSTSNRIVLAIRNWFQNQNNPDPDLTSTNHILNTTFHDDNTTDQGSSLKAIEKKVATVTTHLENGPQNNDLECSEIIIITAMTIAILTSILLR